MKTGLTSYAYAWAIGIPGYPRPATPLDASALLHRAASLGLKVVQLCDNLPLLTLDTGARLSLLQEATTLGIELQVGGRGLTPANFDAHLQLCHDLRASLLRFVIDAPKGYEPSLQEVASFLSRRLVDLEQLGVTLAIENHDRFRAAELAAFIRELDHPRVGICLDTANSLAKGEGFATLFSILGDFTVNLHVKDVKVRRLDHQLGFVVNGCAAGSGVVAPDLAAALPSLLERGRCHSALLESWPEPGTNIAETCAREHTWAVLGAAWLQSFFAG